MNIHSIRAKITAVTIAAILTTVAAVFIAIISTVQVENDRRTAELMELITNDTAKSVERYLDSIQQSVEATASMADASLDSSVLIRTGAAGEYTKPEDRTQAQNTELDTYLEEYCERLQESFGSFADRTYGASSYFYCISPDVSSRVHGFYYSRAGKTGFTENAPINAGRLDSGDDRNVWYYTPVTRGRPSWVGPYRSTDIENTWLCSYVVPVYKAGTLIGVMGLDIPVDTLVSQLSEVKVYDTGHACLLDDNGRVIYHPDFGFGTVPGEDGKTFSKEQLSGRSSGGEPVLYTQDGKEHQMAYTTLSNGMKLVITAPAKEISASWDHLIRMIIIITLALMALFATVAFLVMGHVTRPLGDLTEASERLEAGDYDVELAYDKNDELGVLTRSFTSMRDKQKQAIEDLNKRLYSDALTGQPNMRFFFSLAGIEKKRLADEGKEAAMLYIDLIGMKHFNHQFGFEAGDELLCEIGNLVEAYFGRNCMCRYGDDHFAAITDEEGVEERIGLLLDACERANGGNSLPVSVGIYPYSLGDVGVSIACDRAKYASDTHRGAYVSGVYRFDSGMLDRVENTRYIISRFDRALEEGWIKVYYQPIVRAADGVLCDMEALSRWTDPEKGFMSPGEFIPVLENSRLIYKLDLYVLDRIIEKIKMQEARGETAVPHSVNLSRSDFDSCDIVEEIRRRVDDAGLPRDMITIEVTESMVGDDFEFIKARVLRFQELGFKVWMDDFGSGYSSLDVLQDIRFDLLKLDMRFLKRMDEGEESRIILKEMAEMAAGLGMETICEGVETKEHAEFLRDIGVTKLQGYFFGKPEPYEPVV